MKWFKRIILGLIGLYLIALGLDIFISKSLLQSNLYSGEYTVLNDIKDKNISNDLVVYGSSRSYVHINPIILDKVLNINSYNLGFNGQKIDLQKYRHDIFLSNGYIPKNVIINLDINSLTNEESFAFKKQFIPLLLFNNDLFKLVNNNLRFRCLEIYIPLIRYRKFDLKPIDLVKEIYEIYINPNYKNTNRIKGFNGMNWDWQDKVNESNNIVLENAKINDLINMIEDLKSINSNIILINSPEYISQIKSQTNRKEIINLYQSIANKYQIPFIDYSNDSINHKKELFYNSNHLNSKGADIFTKKLAQDIKLYLKY